MVLSKVQPPATNSDSPLATGPLSLIERIGSTQRLRELIVDGTDIVVTEPVLMEVPAGACSTESAAVLKNMLVSFSWAPLEAATDFELLRRSIANADQNG